VRLRPAATADVDAVLALEVRLFGADAWSAGSVHEELTGPRRFAVVACDPDLVGYAVTMTSADVVDLQRIAVHPDHRRTGVAHRLLARVVEAARADRMLLEVSAANAAALAFYATEGFTEIARRRRYYRDGTDALVLQRLLRPQPQAHERITV
jgi:[ribosomal protein S18]-alanine N-acetyltransferase